jgi:hypothetical protein
MITICLDCGIIAESPCKIWVLLPDSKSGKITMHRRTEVLAAIALRGYVESWPKNERGLRQLKRWLKAFNLYSTTPPDENNKKTGQIFSDYLDEYFNSFDYYPVCSRHLFQKNDAYALWLDFLLVAGDVGTSANRLYENPENYLNLEGWTKEDVKTRKEQIAREIQSRIAAKKPAQ